MRFGALRLPERPGGFGEVLDCGRRRWPKGISGGVGPADVWVGDPCRTGAVFRKGMRSWTRRNRTALERARQSEHDWRAILRDFIAATNPSDYRWAAAEPPHLPSPVHRPPRSGWPVQDRQFLQGGPIAGPIQSSEISSGASSPTFVSRVQ